MDSWEDDSHRPDWENTCTVCPTFVMSDLAASLQYPNQFWLQLSNPKQQTKVTEGLIKQIFTINRATWSLITSAELGRLSCVAQVSDLNPQCCGSCSDINLILILYSCSAKKHSHRLPSHVLFCIGGPLSHHHSAYDHVVHFTEFFIQPVCLPRNIFVF